MKKILASLILVSSFSVFADDAANNTEKLARALMDNSEKIGEMKTKCGNAVSEVVTTSVGAKYKHEIYTGPGHFGDRRKFCKLTIMQDFSQTMVDGPVKYKFGVTVYTTSGKK